MSAADYESHFCFLNFVITGSPNERVKVGWNSHVPCHYECAPVF